jgi:hypothetical protein
MRPEEIRKLLDTAEACGDGDLAAIAHHGVAGLDRRTRDYRQLYDWSNRLTYRLRPRSDFWCETYRTHYRLNFAGGPLFVPVVAKTSAEATVAEILRARRAVQALLDLGATREED